jgi:hypothetical protein
MFRTVPLSITKGFSLTNQVQGVTVTIIKNLNIHVSWIQIGTWQDSRRIVIICTYCPSANSATAASPVCNSLNVFKRKVPHLDQFDIISFIALVVLFWHSQDRASWYILIIKAKKMHYFSTLFWERALHVSDRFTVHHRESSTVFTATGIWHTSYVAVC